MSKRSGVAVTKNAVVGWVSKRRPWRSKRRQSAVPSGCRYPIGHPGEPGFSYCSLPTEARRDFCDRHHALTHRIRTSV